MEVEVDDPVLERLLNASRDVDTNLLRQFEKNRRVNETWTFVLVVLYSAMIVTGAIGNILVMAAVVRKPAMRTARNIFIVNLAVSDFLLCVLTMPLTLLEIISKYWPLGRHESICKMLGTLEGTSIFVSTISITAIALDRYQVIVYPTRESLQYTGAVFCLTLIWLSALVLASPMYFFRALHYHNISIPDININGISYCVEDWPIDHGRMYYSAFLLVFHYIIPILIVSISYHRIYNKLKGRYETTYIGSEVSSNPACERGGPTRTEVRHKRLKRTNLLLVSISVVYCISWLPLDLFNLLSDVFSLRFDQDAVVFFAFCHMIGMTSACTNPLLYGWLNENFRKEFCEIICRDAGVGKGRREELLRLSTLQQQGQGAEGSGDGGGGPLLLGSGSSSSRSAARQKMLLLAGDVQQSETGDTEMTVLPK